MRLTEAEAKIAAVVGPMTLCKGRGHHESACSIAAINIALFGRVTDDIPPCMSEVIGNWIIMIQDAMPAEIRNGDDWKALLPLAAGTGRDHEAERAKIALNWMWEDVLPCLSDVADSEGFGREWRAMLAERTGKAARAAERAAPDLRTRMAVVSAIHATETQEVERRAAWAADAAYAAAKAAAWAAKPIFDPWPHLNPPGLLRQLIAVTDGRLEC